MIIKREYWHTFYSPMTGWQQTISNFHNGASDYVKMNAIFDNHLSCSSSITDEVKRWMSGKWNEWETEKPEWFTDKLINSIPDDYIPKDRWEEHGRGVKVEVVENIRGMQLRVALGASLSILDMYR